MNHYSKLCRNLPLASIFPGKSIMATFGVEGGAFSAYVFSFRQGSWNPLNIKTLSKQMSKQSTVIWPSSQRKPMAEPEREPRHPECPHFQSCVLPTGTQCLYINSLSLNTQHCLMLLPKKNRKSNTSVFLPTNHCVIPPHKFLCPDYSNIFVFMTQALNCR